VINLLLCLKVGVIVNRAFIDYISTSPLQVEVFGHYQRQPQYLSNEKLPRYDSLLKRKVKLTTVVGNFFAVVTSESIFPIL